MITLALMENYALGLPGKKSDFRIEETPKRPRTWEDVEADIEKSKMNLESNTTTYTDVNELDFDNCKLSKVIKFLQKMAKGPTLVYLILPSPSISLMLLSKLGRKNLD